jgi:predicted ATP-grasp superfamily ATP-dependent carboligase
LAEQGSVSHFSRFCSLLEVHGSEQPDAWADFLLGSGSDHLRGSLLLACSDAGIELLIKHRDALAAKFLLDNSYVPAQQAMLDKLATYRAAKAAGIPTPEFWTVESVEELSVLRTEITYPVIVKPRLSHIFEARSGKKLVIADDFSSAAKAVEEVVSTGAGSLIVEMIPGPDDRLCSYYTYLDADSLPLLHFTKRIIRRYPLLMGTGCYHITDWVPETVELGNRLFRQARLQGLANVEFKRDERDGKLKLIECNARFTAADCLVARSGINLAEFVYNYITDRTLPSTDTYELGVRLWDPIRDFQAYLAKRRAGQLNFLQWLSSVFHRQTFAYFQWSDPLPALMRMVAPLRRKLRWRNLLSARSVRAGREATAPK